MYNTVIFLTYLYFIFIFLLNSYYCVLLIFSSVQLLSRVQPFATPWIAARQASLSITNSGSLLKRMSIELVMPSSHLILCCLLLLLPPIPPRIRVFSSESTLRGGQSIGVSASTSFLPMNTQDWSLRWTGWIFLQSKGLSRVFFNTRVQLWLLKS